MPIQTRISLITFGGKKKGDIYKAATLHMINTILNTESAWKDMSRATGRAVNRTVILNDVHSSPTDLKPHYTVDLYCQSEPVGCAHIYTRGDYKIFDARKKAKKAFRQGIGNPFE